jgi:hypothetical protein
MATLSPGFAAGPVPGVRIVVVTVAAADGDGADCEAAALADAAALFSLDEWHAGTATASPSRASAR